MSPQRPFVRSVEKAGGGRRGDLLDAACTVIAERGVRRMRMEDLARQAGVSVGLTYRYFTGRDDLLTAVVDHLAEAAATRSAGAAQTTQASAGLKILLTADIRDDSAARRDARAWSELYAEALFDASLATRLNRANDAWVDDVAAFVGAETFDQDEAHAIATRLVALADGVQGWWVLERLSGDQARHLIEGAVDVELDRDDPPTPGRDRLQPPA